MALCCFYSLQQSRALTPTPPPSQPLIASTSRWIDNPVNQAIVGASVAAGGLAIAGAITGGVVANNQMNENTVPLASVAYPGVLRKAVPGQGPLLTTGMPLFRATADSNEEGSSGGNLLWILLGVLSFICCLGLILLAAYYFITSKKKRGAKNLVQSAPQQYVAPASYQSYQLVPNPSFSQQYVAAPTYTYTSTVAPAMPTMVETLPSYEMVSYPGYQQGYQQGYTYANVPNVY